MFTEIVIVISEWIYISLFISPLGISLSLMTFEQKISGKASNQHFRTMILPAEFWLRQLFSQWLMPVDLLMGMCIK